MLYMLISPIVAFAIAVVLVEKQEQWPATFLRPIISWFLSCIHKKLPSMLDCVACTSFWAAIFSDLMFFAYSKMAQSETYIPAWPLSGFLALALSWTVIQLLNSLDRK